jgi:SAM-dependent methyltransferase
VATRQFLEQSHYERYVRLAQEAGALEVHLLEPCATGRLAGQSDVLLTQAEHQRVLDYQVQAAQDEALPIVSTFLYLESAEAFGCGAGLTHLYIDGSGEVCPCNLVPLAFGNVTQEPLAEILDRMGQHFQRPRTECVGRILGPHVQADQIPAHPEQSMEICNRHLPKEHPVPRFFQVQAEILRSAAGPDLRSVYDRVGEVYDEFWGKEAGKPVQELVEGLALKGSERVYEAGCGTGYATALIAGRLADPSQMTAVDLSEGMLGQARLRVDTAGLGGIQFVLGDALEHLAAGPSSYDLIFSSWVLGYIPLGPFFTAAHKALAKGGCLAFVVHRQGSPRQVLDIFQELAVENPSVLQGQVAFDFPLDGVDAAHRLTAAGLLVEQIQEGQVVFHYDNPGQVLEHLLKSGAGTAYYDAIVSDRQEALGQEFVRRLALRNPLGPPYPVVHDYVACIARKG